MRINDILVSTVRPNLNGVAKLDVRHDGATASTGFSVLRPNATLVDPNYLFQWVKSPAFVADMTRKATGASYPAASDRIVMASRIPLPSIDEQRRIAATLDQADDLRRKRRDALKRLSCLAQACFVEMFGDWSRPGFNRRLVPIGGYLVFLTSGSRGWAEYYREAGSLFLRIQNVKSDELDLSDVAFVDPPQTAEARRTKVEPGDVLLSITADLGRTAVVPEGIGEAFINQHLAILRTSAFVPRYLSAAISSPAGQNAIQRKNREGVKAGLNFDDVRTLEIPAADRSEQMKFAERAAQIDEIKAQSRDQLAKLETLFSSLQNRAFEGNVK